MSFWSNILLAILSVVNPVIGFVGSIVKYIVSEAKNSGFVFLLDIVGNIMPGGFGKDILMGVVSDACEVFSVSTAVEEIVPFNNIILKCERCGIHSHNFLKKDGLITCKNCFERDIGTTLTKKDSIYLIKNNIQIFKKDLFYFNNEKLSKKYYDFGNKDSFPSLSDKYKKFKN